MKRFSIILWILSVVTLIFISRLAYFQLFTEKYKLNAMNTSIKAEYQIPLRGYILDRNGKILVGNTPSYEITFTQAQMNPDFDTLNFCKLINFTKQQFIGRIQYIKAQKNYSPIIPISFLKGIDDTELARIQEQLYKYNAFSIVRIPERNYLVNTAGNILGYINEVNERYIKTDSLYYMPGNLAGMAGVERSYEKELRGVKGIKYIQKDRQSRSIGSYKNGEYDQKMQGGKDLTLTIDYELQKYAEDLLKNKRGAIVAIEPSSGEILAMASSPVIDPSLFVGKNKNKNIYVLQMDSMNKPNYDRAAQAMFPPGSPFKLINGLAAMQMGVIDDKTTFVCKHGFHYGRRKINCHCGFFYVPIPIRKGIQKSCNSFFAETYLRILKKYPNNIEKSIDEWSEIVKSFGLGEFMHTDLPFGSKGNIPNSAYYNKRFGKGKWNPYTIISNSIGQGEILLTPLQMANFAAIIANKGYYYTPHIAKAINGKPITDPQFTQRKYTKVNSKYFDIVLAGMEDVVTGGTARGIKTLEFIQAGKTGTAQNPHGRDHSLFILIAPADKPKIVVAVIVENGGFGATYAGPIASLVAEKYITKNVERKGMEERIEKTNLNGEYKRQWIDHLKRIGKYEPAKPDSIRLLDSIMKLPPDIRTVELKKYKDKQLLKEKLKKEEKEKAQEKEKQKQEELKKQKENAIKNDDLSDFEGD